MDSTVLAYHLFHQGALAGCVSVHYGQRHAKELDCAKRTTELMQVPHEVLNLEGLRAVLNTSSLTSNEIAVPEGHYAEASMKATVVPNRNMILLSLAVGVAIARGAKAVAYGAHAGDHAVYPDCRPEFALAMSQAIGFCDYDPPTLERPFINKTKADIVKLGIELGVNFNNTWTCYKGGEVACGKCGTCVERLEAFHIAGGEDPIPYEDRTYWTRVVEAAGDTVGKGRVTPQY